MLSDCEYYLGKKTRSVEFRGRDSWSSWCFCVLFSKQLICLFKLIYNMEIIPKIFAIYKKKEIIDTLLVNSRIFSEE